MAQAVATDIVADLESTGVDRRFKVMVHLGNYALWLSGLYPDYIESRRWRRGGPDLEYFEDLVRGVGSHARALDAALQPFLDRTVEEVDPIERAMLRIAAYELQHRPDVPYRVVIDEALKAVKRFGSEHGHTYVNGVLDQAAAQWRAAEVQASRP